MCCKFAKIGKNMPGNHSTGNLFVTKVTNYVYVSTRYYCLEWFLCGATEGRGKPHHRNKTKERMGLLLNLL